MSNLDLDGVLEEIVYSLQQPKLTEVTQTLIAQARKIHMFDRMNGNVFGNAPSGNRSKNFKQHMYSKKEILPKDVTCGTKPQTWRVTSSDASEGSVLVTHNWGTDFLCDCIDYPFDYVCKDCKICIHMYSCSCGEAESFPALICKHIHAVFLYGEGAVQKPDIEKHIITPHRSPGHKWPNPIIYRFNVKSGKCGSPKTLVPISSESVNVYEEVECGRYMLPEDWDSDDQKYKIAQEQIKNDIMNVGREQQELEDFLLNFKKTYHSK